MKMDAGIDTGPLLSQREIDILPEETGGTLLPKLARLGAELLIDTLPSYISGELQPQAQQGEATYAPMLNKSDGQLDFTQSAEGLERKIRAFNPWPGAFMDFTGGRLKIHRTRIAESTGTSSEPGKRVVLEGFPAVHTSSGSLVLMEVQPAGKKPMSGEVFLHGARDWMN